MERLCYNGFFVAGELSQAAVVVAVALLGQTLVVAVAVAGAAVDGHLRTGVGVGVVAAGGGNSMGAVVGRSLSPLFRPLDSLRLATSQSAAQTF